MKIDKWNKLQKLTNVKIDKWNKLQKQLAEKDELIDKLRKKQKKILSFVKKVYDFINDMCPAHSMCELAELDCPDSYDVSCNYIDWFQETRDIIEDRNCISCKFTECKTRNENVDNLCGLWENVTNTCNNCRFVDCLERHTDFNMCSSWGKKTNQDKINRLKNKLKNMGNC